MNLNTDQKIALGIMTTATVALGCLVVLDFLSHRAYKKEIKRIHAETALDLEAIRLTGEQMREKLNSNHLQFRTAFDIMKTFDETLAFNKIAVRNK